MWRAARLLPGKIRRAPGEPGNNSHPATFQQQSPKKLASRRKPLSFTQNLDYSEQTSGGMTHRLSASL
jgi:hypothetical protein